MSINPEVVVLLFVVGAIVFVLWGKFGDPFGFRRDEENRIKALSDQKLADMDRNVAERKSRKTS